MRLVLSCLVPSSIPPGMRPGPGHSHSSSSKFPPLSNAAPSHPFILGKKALLFLGLTIPFLPLFSLCENTSTRHQKAEWSECRNIVSFSYKGEKRKYIYWPKKLSSCPAAAAPFSSGGSSFKNVLRTTMRAREEGREGDVSPYEAGAQSRQREKGGRKREKKKEARNAKQNFNEFGKCSYQVGSY